MAEENITQLSAAMLKLQEDIAKLGYVTQASAEQLKDAQMKAKYGSESYTKGVNAAGQALGALAGAGIESAKAMYQGKKDATAMNGALGELSKAAALAATALTFLLPGGAIIKGVAAAFALFTSATVGIVQAANEMNAKLFKSYEGLQKAGGAASDGMTGVFKDAKKLGLSMDELDSYVGLVAENSQELAMFAGSVAGGRKKFADMGEALESSRVGFFAMGISQQEQNEGMMRFTRTMTQTGRAQTMTSKELADGARSYIMEQDKLAKLTGISAQKQQALLDRARDNEQFNAKIRSLELEGTAESKAAADGLRKGLIFAAAAGDDVAEGFMASVNGNLKNEKARELNMTAQGEQMRSIQNILNGMDPAQAMQPMFKSMSNFEKTTGIALNQLGAGSGVFNKSSSMAEASNLANMGVAEMAAKIEKDTALQQAGAADAITAQEARHMKERQDLNKKAEENIFKTIASAQMVNDKMLGATNVLIDLFDKLAEGIRRLLNILPGGNKSSEPPPPPKMGSLNRMPAASTTGAASGTVGKPEAVLQFNGASGSRKNFDGLNGSMQTSLMSAGQQYFDQTGQKLQMNSGFRSPEDQLRLYNETKDAKRPGRGPTGMPVAQPGSSPHETGMAVDIQNYTDPKALSALNSAGLRQTVPKDPVHFQLQAADGGVFSGPDSGYPAALHGEEAVIPLNNSGGNFVKIFEDMAMMIGKQTGAIDELIRVAKNGNDIQTKILRQQT